MHSPQPSKIIPERLREAVAGPEPVAGIALPSAVANALELIDGQLLDRDEWRSWIGSVPDLRSVLLWISPRREDDQEFLSALAKALHPDALLHSFHSMAMMTVDRLTGDAVQSLLNASGLSDRGCANTGMGYYTRRFVRSSDAGPVELPEWWGKPAPELEPEPESPPEQPTTPNRKPATKKSVRKLVATADKPVESVAETPEQPRKPAKKAASKRSTKKAPAKSSPKAKGKTKGSKAK